MSLVPRLSLCLIAVSLFVLVVFSQNRPVNATTFALTGSLTLDSLAPSTPSGISGSIGVPGGNANVARVYQSLPSEWMVPMDAGFLDGTSLGNIDVNSTLGVLNGPCFTPIPTPVPLMEGTTDPSDSVESAYLDQNLVLDDDADTIVEAEDTNGVPTYADHFPAYLSRMLDPDGPGGPDPAIQPRLRLVGHAMVGPLVRPLVVNLLFFNPGSLGDPSTGLGLPESALDASFGYAVRIELNGSPDAGGFPVWAPVGSPSTVTDICSPLSFDTRIEGSTRGQVEVRAGPPPFEIESIVTECGAASGISSFLVNEDNFDDDGDTFPDDGCLHIPDPCGGVDYDGDTTVTLGDGEDPLPATNDDGDGTTDERCGTAAFTNPAASTGLLGTGTRVFRTYTASMRDADGDGIESALDACPLNVNNSVDVDADGLDSACDPNDAVMSPVAPAPDNVNSDGDSWPVASGPAETGAQCTGTGTPPSNDPPHLDDDGDGVINDGCGAAIDEDPVNTADDDGDTRLDEDGECITTSGLPDQDLDCHANRGDNCALVSNANQSDLDALPAAADAGTAWDSIGDACDPGPPVAEAACADAMDNDSDTRVNDGCVSAGTRPEVGPECENATNDDRDTQRTTATGDDTADDALVNDGCPAAGGGTANGHYHSASPVIFACVPNPSGADDSDGDTFPDDDFDGICDSTEVLLGSDKDSTFSRPEVALDSLPADNDGNTVVDVSPQLCGDLTSYPGGIAIDNDGDTFTNAADPGCLGSGNDFDGDGHWNTDERDKGSVLVDPGSTPEHCDAADNDGDTVLDEPPALSGRATPDPLCAPGADPDGDTIMNAADTDDDDDGFSDANEQYMSTDELDDCRVVAGHDAWPPDANADHDADVGDVIQLFGSGKTLQDVGDPFYSRRSDANGNGTVNVGDVIALFGGGIILTTC